MAANQNHHASGKLVGKANSPARWVVACAEGAGAFPLSSSDDKGKILLLCVLCVSAVHN